MTPRPRFVLPLLAGLALAPRPVLANPTAVAALPTIANTSAVPGSKATSAALFML